MVPLFVPEPEWSPARVGLTHDRYVRSQIEHGLQEEGYGYWGFSPPTSRRAATASTASTPSACRRRATTPSGSSPRTPSFLALPHARGGGRRQPEGARRGLRRVRRHVRVPGLGGRHDGPGQRLPVLALDQGMVAAALAQQLSPGLLQRPFRTGGFAARVRPLLAKERFSISAAPEAAPKTGAAAADAVGASRSRHLPSGRYAPNCDARRFPATDSRADGGSRAAGAALAAAARRLRLAPTTRSPLPHRPDHRQGRRPRGPRGTSPPTPSPSSTTSVASSSS